MSAREFDTCVVCGNDYSVAADDTVRTHGPRNARCPGSRRLGIQSQEDTRVALGWSARRSTPNPQPEEK